MPRATRKIEAANIDDPKIKALMVTRELNVPPDNHFQGYISESDIADIQSRDRKTMLTMSVNAQWTDWLIETVIDLHTQLREVDAENAKLRLKEQDKDEQRFLWKLWRGSMLAVGGGGLVALGQWVVKRWLGP